MTSDRLNQLEQQFEQEHEKEARLGWPLMITTPAFAEVYANLSPQANSALGDVALDAIRAYSRDTDEAYRDYRATHASATTEDEKTEAWRHYNEATAEHRARLRAQIWAGIYSALPADERRGYVRPPKRTDF